MSTTARLAPATPALVMLATERSSLRWPASISSSGTSSCCGGLTLAHLLQERPCLALRNLQRSRQPPQLAGVRHESSALRLADQRGVQIRLPRQLGLRPAFPLPLPRQSLHCFSPPVDVRVRA